MTQQSLMLARLLIHEPRWVVIDEVLDAIDGETRTRALEIFARDLKDAAIIHIGRGNSSRSYVHARLPPHQGSQDPQAGSSEAR